MGAILPSSAGLARAMVDEARIEPDDVVLELGAGSGSFTTEIVSRHADNPLYLVEPGEALVGQLRERFPAAVVSARRAEDLGAMAQELGMPKVDRVVSGLPWALWPEARQAAILDALLPLLAADARLVTFHYVHSRMLGRVSTLRRLLQARFHTVEHSTPIWPNVPPAYVHIAANPRLPA